MIVKHFLVILGMMDVSHPPYSCDLAPAYSPPSRRLQVVQQNITTEQTAVPLDAFELLFYQLLEIYNMCVADRGSVFERKKSFVLFSFVPIRTVSLLELYCVSTYLLL